ncbi:alpha/beta hydrolase [Cohnella soli]|uniref:Alpha/beta hydrolase n=1 Tax=Cohnella soli TaxID=425005 RepID=A0ABW0I2M6_9BACL
MTNFLTTFWRRVLLPLLLGCAVGVSGCGGVLESASPEETPIATTMLAKPAATPEASISVEAPPDPMPSKLLKLTFHSEALNHNMRLQVYEPPGYDPSRRYPVLYLLHGYNAMETAWLSEMRMSYTADRMIAKGSIQPFFIVAPEMDNSYGLNTQDEYQVAVPSDPVHSRYYGRYEDYFVEDVIGYIDSHFSTIASREGRWVGGYSMGGFISLSDAFRHPELFSKVGGHSAALWLNDWSRVPMMKSWLYPTKKVRKERDPIALAESADLSGIEVYLDVGDKDDFKLYDGAKELFGILQKRGVVSQLHVNPGKHNRTYWKSQLENYLKFYAGSE